MHSSSFVKLCSIGLKQLTDIQNWISEYTWKRRAKVSWGRGEKKSCSTSSLRHAGTVACVPLSNPSQPAYRGVEIKTRCFWVWGVVHTNHTHKESTNYGPLAHWRSAGLWFEPPSSLHQSNILPSVTWIPTLHHNFTNNYTDLSCWTWAAPLFISYIEIVNISIILLHQDFRLKIYMVCVLTAVTGHFFY